MLQSYCQYSKCLLVEVERLNLSGYKSVVSELIINQMLCGFNNNLVPSENLGTEVNKFDVITVQHLKRFTTSGSVTSLSCGSSLFAM